MQPQESTKKPLEQFGQDFTALAREGKLDPVIGRIDKNDIQHIIEMQLAAFLEEVEKSKDIRLEFSKSAKRIIDGSIQSGSVVTVDYTNNAFHFDTK